jgi:hypothetical protein
MNIVGLTFKIVSLSPNGEYVMIQQTDNQDNTIILLTSDFEEQYLYIDSNIYKQNKKSNNF